jgi:hypothetical protein
MRCLEWLYPQKCPVAHYHRGDPTCRAGGSGNESGAQNGPHYHIGSVSCHAGDDAPPGSCKRPHHHVGDPTWRPADG